MDCARKAPFPIDYKAVLFPLYENYFKIFYLKSMHIALLNIFLFYNILL